MHQPRPFGRFVEGAELSSEDAAAVAHFAKTLTNFKSVSSLDSYRRRVVLPSGRVAVGVDAGGTFRVRVYEPQQNQGGSGDGKAQVMVPMLFSGCITSAVVRQGEGVGVKLTQQARRRLVGYRPNAALPPSDMKLMRFRIEYPQPFKYFEPSPRGIYTFTQYDKLRPTWYSGAMMEVMQVVSGYGRQDLGASPGDPWEGGSMQLPKKWYRRVERELRHLRLPGYSGMPVSSGEFVYDYRAALCHCVGFDEENRPWLLRINARGVFAMPLPMVPATMTPSFREYIEEMGDTEILALLDRFGGMPSGESFPLDGPDFEAWRRAGVIIKICDCADFYQHTAMYEAGGWSMNSRGSEGYNTCREWNGQTWLAHGYMMQLFLRSAKNHGRLEKSWQLNDPQESADLAVYLSNIYKKLNGSPGSLAIKYKLRRFTGAQLLALARGQQKTDARYWDALEMEPIAPHTGHVARSTSGNLWHPGKYPSAFGAIKFPELRGQGCASIDITAPEYLGPPLRCDTVVFGCYVRDQLRTIKYFYEPREVTKTEEGDFEDLMIVGAWEKKTTEGMTGIEGKVYVTDLDDRRERSPSVTTTKLVGTDVGYGQPAWHTPGTLFRVGSLTRARYYEHRTEVLTEVGKGLVCSAVVPVFARDCILYALQESAELRKKDIETSLHSILDPNSYEFWTHDDIFHYLGTTRAGNVGDPKPKLGAPVWLDTYVYEPLPGSDFADSGSWYGGGLPIDVTGVVGPYTKRGSSFADGVVIGGMAPGWEPFSSSEKEEGVVTGRSHVVMPSVGTSLVHKRRPDDWYFLLSPQDAGGITYFYRDACWIAFGARMFASLSELDEHGNRKRWGESSMGSATAARHFIGVINE